MVFWFGQSTKRQPVYFSVSLKSIGVVSPFSAIHPLKWQADVRELGAESTFWVGGKLSYCHRNDINAAVRPVNATAVQFRSAAAMVALLLTGK